MQMKSTLPYSELIPCFGKRFARKNMAAVSSGIEILMSALTVTVKYIYNQLARDEHVQHRSV